VFFEVQRGLPRQGPGSRESTLKALKLCAELPENPVVLDIGCGPGMQTIDIAKSSSGSITAVDNCGEYLEELRHRAEQASLSDRIEVKNADMTALDFSRETFDLIWCEAAIYSMGVAEALRSWRPLLHARGSYLVFSELVWLDRRPHGDVIEFWANGYPAMTTVEGVKKAIRETGYEPLGDFTIPDSAWWDDYYTPLEAKLETVKQQYEGDEKALGIVAMTEKEIDIRRRFGQSYGYQFFVTRKFASR
jgi:SAM-dependent methyltransferase